MSWLFQARKLKNVRRCGVLHANITESVAEHSLFVTMLVTELGQRIYKKHKIDLNWPVLLKKAIFHDIEEAITGDIPYPVKYSSETLHELLEGAKDIIVKEFFPEWVVELNKTAKSGLEGEIVHIADYIELYCYCVEEKISGNRDKYWDEIMETCRRICNNTKFNAVAIEMFNEIDLYANSQRSIKW